MNGSQQATQVARRTRIGVWSLLCLVLAVIVTTLGFTDGLVTSPEGTSPVLSSPSFEREGNSTALAKVDPSTGNPTASAGATGGAPWSGAYNTSSLPAWRWTSVTLDADTTGNFLASAINQFPVMVATLLFSIANLFWLLLLGVLRIGLNGSDLLVNVVTPINASIAWLGTHLWVFAPLFWALALGLAAKDLFRLRIVTALRSLLLFALMFAALVAVTGNSLKALDKPNKNDQLNTAGTLPWLADTVSDLAINAVAPMTGLVVRASNGPAAAAEDLQNDSTSDIIANEADNTGTGPLIKTQGPTPTCEEYINTLEDTYLAGPESNNAMVVVSRLWQNTLYNSWTVAQFGLPQGAQNLPGRAMCHYAEINNGKPGSQQYKVARAAYPDADIGEDSLVFGPYYNIRDERRAVAAWTACQLGKDGSWKTNSAFDGTWGRRALDGGDEDVFFGDYNCYNIMSGEGRSWYQGVDLGAVGDASDTANSTVIGASPLSLGLGLLDTDPDQDPYYIFGESADIAFGEVPGEVGAAKVAPAYSWALSTSGANGADRILQSIIALLTAAAFAISFGGIAIGLLFAQLLLIACLMFVLPVAFVLVAVGAQRQGMQLVRLTAAAMLAQAGFIVLITALLLISGLFQSLFLYIALPAIIASVLYGLAPVAAWVILRKALQKMGFGDIASMTGALSFATSATLRSAGGNIGSLGRAGSDGKSPLANRISKAPWVGKKLENFDSRFAPNRWGARINPSVTARMRRERERKQRAYDAQKNVAAQRVKNQFLADQIAGRKNTRYGRARNFIDRQLMSTSATRQALQGAGALAGVVFLAAGPWALGAAPLGIAAAGTKILKDSKSSRDWFRERSRASSFSELGRTTPGAYRPYVDPVAYRHPTRISGQDSRDALLNMRTDALNRARQGSLPMEDGSDGMEALATTISDQIALARGMGAGEILIDERQRLLAELAAGASGYQEKDIYTTAGGIAIARPLTREEMKDAPIEQLKDFQHWMREDEKGRLIKPDGTQEEPQDVAARLVVSGIMRGGMSANGEPIDFLAANGIDISDPNTEKELRSWLAGNSANPRFDSLVASPVNSALEQRLVNSMYQVVQSQFKQSIDMQISMNQDRAQELKVSIENLPGDSAALDKKLDRFSTTLDKLSASADRLASARERGDAGLERAAAEKHARIFDDFEELQRETVEQFAELHARTVQASVAAAATMGYSESDVQALLGKSSEAMTEAMEKLVRTLEGARSGTVPDDEVRRTLKELKRGLDKQQGEALELAEEARDSLSNIEDLLGKGGPRNGPEAPNRARQYGADREGVPT